MYVEDHVDYVVKVYLRTVAVLHVCTVYLTSRSRHMQESPFTMQCQ